MREYGFIEGKDFYSKPSKTSENGGRPSMNYHLTIRCGKEICMIQRTEEGLFEIKEYKGRHSKHAGTQTLLTPKGRETFRMLLSGIDE